MNLYFSDLPPSDTEPCSQPCDCKVSHWSPWGPCSVTCHHGNHHRHGIRGYQVRMRTIKHEESHGGLGCPVLKETRVCRSDSSPRCPKWVALRVRCHGYDLLVTLGQVLFIASIVCVGNDLYDKSNWVSCCGLCVIIVMSGTQGRQWMVKDGIIVCFGWSPDCSWSLYTWRLNELLFRFPPRQCYC